MNENLHDKVIRSRYLKHAEKKSGSYAYIAMMFVQFVFVAAHDSTGAHDKSMSVCALARPNTAL